GVPGVGGRAAALARSRGGSAGCASTRSWGRDSDAPRAAKRAAGIRGRNASVPWARSWRRRAARPRTGRTMRLKLRLPKIDLAMYRRIYRELGPHMWPHKALLIGSGASALAIPLGTLLQPWPLKNLFDHPPT